MPVASLDRRVNSCSDPNAHVKTIGGVRHVVARRPVKPGEGITYDYTIDCRGGIGWRCGCGRPRWRGNIVSCSFERRAELQLEYLPLLNDWFIEGRREEVAALRKRASGA